MNKRSMRSLRNTIMLAVVLVAAVGLAFVLYKLALANRSSIFSRKDHQTDQQRQGRRRFNLARRKYVAYSALDESGQSSLWVRHVATTSNVQIVPPAGADVQFGGAAFLARMETIFTTPGGKRTRRVCSTKCLCSVARRRSCWKMSGQTPSVSLPTANVHFHPRYASQGADALMLANADGTGEQNSHTHIPRLLLAARRAPDAKQLPVRWEALPAATTEA